MYEDLRQFTEALEKQGQLVRVTRPVDRKYEIAAVVRKVCDREGPAVLFENVIGSDIPILANLFGTYRRVAAAFDTSETKLHSRVIELFGHYPVATRLVTTGPVKEVILTGDDATLDRLPIPTSNALDGGPYITFGVQIVKKNDAGTLNASVHRMQVHSRDRLGIMADPPRHLGWCIVAADKENKPLEMAVVIGCAPAVLMSAISAPPYDWDELALAGAFMEKPVEMVQCETIDVQVPATAEIVIEGELLPGVRQTEGPFGEATGYYDLSKTQRPVFKVKAITHRQNPIFLAVLGGMPITDIHVLNAFPKSPVLLRDLMGLSPRALDVYFLPECAFLCAVIKMKKSFIGPAEEEAKRFAFAAFARFSQLKIAIIVDEDVNIYSRASVMWAIATRVRPDLDVFTFPRCTSTTLEVAYGRDKKPVGGKMIIDATWKYEGFPPHADPPREMLDKINIEDWIPGLK